MPLGKLEQITDLRSEWAHEASDFTPWLAQPENLEALGHELGLELELIGTEVPVGPYSADILASTANDRKVVIENQLEKTDHDHLGKMLTYSAILDASIVVWIAKRFTDEHRKTLDWLNDHSDDTLQVFGICMELWKIGGSQPAPRFNVVSRPAELLKQARADRRPRGELTEAKKLQFKFWVAVKGKLQESNTIPSLQTPQPKYWFNVALGRSKIHISAIADTMANRIGVRLYLRNTIADAALEQLQNDKQRIHEEIGAELTWNPNPENQDKIVLLDQPADLKDESKWDENVEWITETILRFRNTFRQRVRELDLSVDTVDTDTDTDQ